MNSDLSYGSIMALAIFCGGSLGYSFWVGIAAKWGDEHKPNSSAHLVGLIGTGVLLAISVLTASLVPSYRDPKLVFGTSILTASVIFFIGMPFLLKDDPDDRHSAIISGLIAIAIFWLMP